ncbi:hypothetical protein J2Y63_006757 [Shinella sp. BE166]|uniref:pyridoxamine 5'-phosphate oxidase family protein n=1 Tax=Shinella sp. BE166 TaxID=3373918 RepID=UPI003EC0A163
MAQGKNDQDKVWELAKDIGFCMLTTQSGNALRARPMSADADREAHAFHFLTNIPGAYSLKSRPNEAKGFHSFRDRYHARTCSRGDGDVAVMLSATEESSASIAVTTCLLHIVRRHR